MKMTIHWMAVLTWAIPAWAQATEPARRAPQPPPLLSHEALQERLSEPTLRVLDARPRADYDKGHIPGALWIDVKALQALAKPETIGDQAAWTKGLAYLAIGADTEVYIYDADRQHDAGRVWWLLSYAGAPKVGLIDGGFPLWAKKDRPVSAKVPSVEAKEFPIHFHARRAVSREEVRSALKSGDAQLIDARSAAEYRGDVKPRDGSRAGHIPSARSLDAYELVDADGVLLEPAALLERLTKAGVSSEKPIIVYSQGGGRSGLVLFALRRLGIPARHYYHGLADWVRETSAPIVTGAEPGQPSAE
jgi:thiosulfate/3-mercaptopyruvate sulfurtransferase